MPIVVSGVLRLKPAHRKVPRVFYCHYRAMQIDVRTNIAEVVVKMREHRRAVVERAVPKAMNETTWQAQLALKREIVDVFDRPTPFTRNAIERRYARRGHLRAVVQLKDFTGKGAPPSKYLAAQIRGGARRPKKFEKAMQGIGALPPGYRAVPGKAAQMDAYGNMKPSQLVQILSYFRTFSAAGHNANMNDKGRARLARGNRKRGVQGFTYFIGRPADGKLPLGVWQRLQFAHGSAIKPVLIFVPQAIYEAIFDFDYVAQKTIESEFPRQLEQAIRDATAR